MVMGRPNKGVEHVDRVDASEHERERLKVILRTITGELSVQDACAELGISPKRFQQLREQCLQGAADALAPGRPGRPRRHDAEVVELVAELQREVARLRVQVDRQRIRLELHGQIPGLAERAQKGGGGPIHRAVESLSRR